MYARTGGLASGKEKNWAFFVKCWYHQYYYHIVVVHQCYTSLDLKRELVPEASRIGSSQILHTVEKKLRLPSKNHTLLQKRELVSGCFWSLNKNLCKQFKCECRFSKFRYNSVFHQCCSSIRISRKLVSGVFRGNFSAIIAYIFHDSLNFIEIFNFPHKNSSFCRDESWSSTGCVYDAYIYSTYLSQITYFHYFICF